MTTSTAATDSKSYLSALFWHMQNRPEAEAFRLDEEALTFGELLTRAQRYAKHLRERCDIQPGDRVLCRLGTSLEMLVALVGHYLLGAIHVPVNPRYGEVEMGHILEDSGASVMLVDDAVSLAMLGQLPAAGTLKALITVGHLEPDGQLPIPQHPFHALLAAEPHPDHAADLPLPHDDEAEALCIYTSGTTGKSKGVILSFRAIVAGIEALTSHWRIDEQDVMVLALPLFHVHGLGIGVHGTLIQGCRAILQPHFSPEQVIAAIAHEGGTVFLGVPTMYARLVRALEEDPSAADKLRDARLFASGSAALSAALFQRFEQLTGHRILERYGMSETLLTISNPYDPALRKPGTIGFPIASCEARIVNDSGEICAIDEVGELWVKGASLMTRYWQDEKATREAFEGEWFRTGDAARYDEQGYIVHVGRQSVDILKVGGYKVSAREIEEALSSHVEVAECAVVGLPDEEWGEQIVAVVVPVEGLPDEARHTLDERLLTHLKPLLASYKLPRRLDVRDELPRNALGKLQKHQIIAAL